MLEKPELVDIKKHYDHRGWFSEVMHECEQVNMSFSQRGVLRGMHYQEPPYAQTKKVMVLKGLIEDVIVNLKTKEVHNFVLAPFQGLYVPKHYAHGFRALEDSIIMYGTDEFYNPEADRVIHYNSIDYDWGRGYNILSDRDKDAPSLESILGK